VDLDLGKTTDRRVVSILFRKVWRRRIALPQGIKDGFDAADEVPEEEADFCSNRSIAFRPNFDGANK
jgi:hypothetical protein